MTFGTKLDVLNVSLCKGKMRESPTLHCEVKLWSVAAAHR
jgi:hypothetical protein